MLWDAVDRHLLGDGEVVVLGVLPVDQPDRGGPFANLRLDLHPVAEEAVDLAVRVVEGPGAAQSRGLVQLEQHLADDLVIVPLPLKPGREQALLDVGVPLAILPMAEVVVAERIPEERDHALLGLDLALADRTHPFISSRDLEAQSL